MSTRCTIAVISNDGTGQYISCHCDGYPEWNGRLLLNAYPTREDAESIMKMGDLASLGKSLQPKPDDNDPESRKDGTTAYHRDWGREWHECQPRHLKQGLVELDRLLDDSDSKFVYAFVGGCWMVCLVESKNASGRIWKPLSRLDMRELLPDPYEEKESLEPPKPYKDCTIEELKAQFIQHGKDFNLIAANKRERIVDELRRRGLNFHEVFSCDSK